MRKSTMLVILAMVVILATPVLSKEVSRTSWRVDEAPSVVKDLTEGFEGVFPPTGWTRVRRRPTRVSTRPRSITMKNSSRRIAG